MKDVHTVRDLGGNMREKQTFILEVNDTKSCSWQGKIEWIQGQKKQSLRSVMELLKLIDSVVCDEERIRFENSLISSELYGNAYEESKNAIIRKLLSCE